MEVGKIRRRIMAMFFVVWVITATGQTAFLEAANASYASNPSPADGAVIVGDMVSGNISTALVFVPGATAVEHTGYFSDDYSKVESRAQDANLGPPPYGEFVGYEYTFWVGNPGVPPADESLVRGTTYYWCVDETDALGTTYPGDIWEFNVQDYKACCPNPPDGAVVSGPDVLLSWVPGYGAEDHDIYFGTDFDDVNNAVYDPFTPPPEFLATRPEPNILVTGLAGNTWYYWRVDEIIGRVPPYYFPAEFYKGDVWSFKTAGTFSGSGSGTEADPYIITTVQQLQEMQNDLDACYALGNDIDASDTINWNGGEGFLQVGPDTGDPNDSFTGKFDGRGHVITGLYINRPSTGSVGLFGFIYQAQITNVGLINADVTALGGAGTLVGSSEASTITNSWASGTVRGTHSIQSPLGGLIGWTGGVGGFVSKCHSSVDVFAISSGSPANRTGGLVGTNSRGSIIEDCYATGNVSAKYKVGGLVGDNILYSEYGGYIARCYSTGHVTGTGGGLIGYNYRGGITYDSYWDTQTSGKTTSYGGTPKPTSDMKKQATFVGWDFVNTWDIQENVTYPFLRGAGVGTGPVAHWKFDEGTGSVAYDSAGTNDGTVSGAAWTTGIIDGALDFDGVDDYVAVTDNPTLSPEQITVSAWIYPEDVSHNFQIVGKWGMYNPPCDYVFDNKNNNDGLRFASSMNLSGYDMVEIYSEDAVLNTNMWQHVAVTWDGSMCTFYVNSENVGEDSNYSGNLPDSDNPVYIGRNYNWGTGGPRPLDGKMDDVRIYDRALSAVEIEELYNSVPVPPVGKTYHVDGVNGDNTNDGLTKETAFKTIQRGINVAEDFDTVLVWPGVYNEEVSFWGNAITVKSAADAAIVETDYGYAFSFFSAEGRDTVLSNFVIRNSQYGIYLINGASPKLCNLTIVDNDFGISAFNGADPDISSCIFWNNYYGDLFRDPLPLEAKYSWVQDEVNEPIAHWKLDEGTGSVAYDSAGTNDGIIYGAAWTTGQIGSALSFDGSDDYVTIPDSPYWDFGAGNFSISAWIRMNTSELGNYGVIVGRWLSTSNQARWELYKDADYGIDTISVYVSSDGIGKGSGLINASTGAGSVTSNVWYHVVGLRDGNQLKIYLDGTEKESTFIGFSIPDDDLPVMMGRHNHGGPHYFDGLIDDVRIYDQALSAEEVEVIYEAGVGGLSYGEPGFVDAAGGDYHLLSERGRYWPAHDVWVLDDVTSPCIDGGDPAVDPSNERMPNGGRINMGAYGNTAYASMSECWSKSDFNCDGAVDFKDFAIMAVDWLEKADWIE